jgi:hypothetical protein
MSLAASRALVRGAAFLYLPAEVLAALAGWTFIRHQETPMIRAGLFHLPSMFEVS